MSKVAGATNWVQTRGVVILGCFLVGGCSSRIELSRVSSPSGRFVLETYSIDGGPMTPFNEYLGLKYASGSLETVARVLEAPFQLRGRWDADTAVIVTVDCGAAPAACAPSPDRHWLIEAAHRWRDITILYEVGDRLRQTVTPDVLQRVESAVRAK